MGELQPASWAERIYPSSRGLLPGVGLTEGRYRMHFAASPDELEAAQRLRYEVFNLELGEGLEESHLTGLDEDEFDPQCHHLLVTEQPSGGVIGTYRVQTAEMAAAGRGFYSAGEYDFSGLPAHVVAGGVETGRACIAREHRNRRVLFLLWRGLAQYVTQNRRRYLFGCCSLTSQDTAEGRRVMAYLEARGAVHPEIRLRPLSGLSCGSDPYRPPDGTKTGAVRLPKLFELYLRYGAQVCSAPAIDRAFGTIDYLVLLDVESVHPDLRRLYLG